MESMNSKFYKQKIRQQSLAKGTFILSLSIFLVKVLGMMFRVFVTGNIGPTGATCFTLAYEIYNPLFALSTAGLPIAVARIVSKNMATGNYRNVKEIYKITVPLFTILGISGTFIMLLASTFVPNIPFINIPDAKYAIAALSPTILFACLMSIYRGYHQGLKDVVPTAISEIIEASCKFFIGYIISYLIIKNGKIEFLTKGTVFGKAFENLDVAMSKGIIPIASAGAIFGVTIGAILGFIYLFLVHKKRGNVTIEKENIESIKFKIDKKQILKELLKTALPIGIGSIIFNISSFIDVTLILNRIQHAMKFNPQILLEQYRNVIPESSFNNVHGFLLGCFSFANPLTMMVPAVAQCFGTASLPTITRAYVKNNKELLKKSMESVIKMSLSCTAPAGIFISILGPNLLKIIYPHRPEAVFVASKIILVLGIGIIFQALSITLSSMLQAIGRMDLPLKITTTGLIIKIIINYLLVGIPEINIKGAGFSTFFGYLFILVFSFYFLFKETKVVPDVNNIFFKPITASCIFGISLTIFKFLFSTFLNNLFTLVFSLIFSSFLYFISLIYLKVINLKDIKNYKLVKKVLSFFSIFRKHVGQKQ